MKNKTRRFQQTAMRPILAILFSIRDVWALVNLPDSEKFFDDYGFSMKRGAGVHLKEQNDGLWSGLFSGFLQKGDYTITFMAMDNEGFITDSEPVVLTLENGLQAEELKDNCAPVPEFQVFLIPDGGDAIKTSHIHAESTFNAQTSQSETIIEIKTGCYQTPVDVYIADLLEGGSIQFLDQSAAFTPVMVPYISAEHNSIMQDIAIDALTGYHNLYWLITPSNGGDINKSLDAGMFELGRHTYTVQ